MESVSRPPHRRKHSSGNAFSSSFSIKNPYDDVLLPNGGKKKPFGAHDYAEIFSGPSNIPVLDLSALDERVGSGEIRSVSKVDYSNIFGGLRNDDVAVPYEELFSRSSKKIAQRIPVAMRPPLQESDSVHFSGKKTKRTSGDVEPDQSADGVKQQFNMAFNKTSQINIDASDGKTHIAQIHAVPAFTYFVDGIPQSHKTDERPSRSLKREVSRTWSFSAEVEKVKGKGGSSRDKSDRSPTMNEISSNAPPAPAQTSNLDPIKDPQQSRASNIASKQKVSEKKTGTYSPPILEEELDENSAAAVSAAALKKAIEQAEASIRLAKMIMKRKQEGLPNVSKPKSKDRPEVRDKKETRADREGYGSNHESANGKYDRFDPIFSNIAGVDRNIAPSRGDGKTYINAGKAVEERVRENVADAKEYMIGVGKISPSFLESEPLQIAAKMEPEKPQRKGFHRDETDFPGLVAHDERGTATFKTGNVKNNNTSVLLMDKLTSKVEQKESIKEIVEPNEVIIHQVKEPDVVIELVENAYFQRTHELEKSISEAQGPCQAKKEPENNVEQVQRVVDTSESSLEHATLDGKDEILSAFQPGELITEREIVGNNERKHEKKSEVHCKVNVEPLAWPRSVFDLNEARILIEQVEMKVKSESDVLVKGLGELQGGEGDGMGQKEARADSFHESEVQLEEVLEEELSEVEPGNTPLAKKFDDEVNYPCKPEIDDNKDIHQGDGQNVSGEMDDNEIGERHLNASENEVVGTEMETVNSSKFQTSPVVCGTEEATRCKENQNQYEIPKVACEEKMNDSVDANTSESSVFGGTQSNDAGIRDEEYNRASEASSANSADQETEGLLHFEDNMIPETGCLRRSASEEILSGSRFLFEGFSSDGKNQDAGVMDVCGGENVPKDEVDASKLNYEVHDAEQEQAAKIRVDPSIVEKAEICSTDTTHVLGQSSESNQASASSSSSPLESVAGSSADESEQRAENGIEQVMDKEEVKHDHKMSSREGVCVEEQSEAVYAEYRSRPAYFKEPEKVAESSQNMEEKENLVGSSKLEKKATKPNVSNFDRDDYLRRIEAIKRGREREKNRIVVERAIREARERAFAEARERAERAAVEKAAAEVRQRMMAEAREKFEKQAAASAEARLRAERAAVERATVEARERALDKAVSLKTSTEVRLYGDRNPSDRVSSSSRNNGLKHSYSSSDLEKLNGENTESAQRRKARLERHQRIMERAAKALEEKNMRDLRVQKEQAERNRLAESLDAEIKRWATGKEGNLRALLSTLQYILGPNSGWQPISLTEIITASAVKKAYRKATLYVHPDKLQQRGASIQQKYICEKVFDLLKAAWNRFNSEER